jgi:serine/threonine-protein kinase RsbW
MVRRLQLPSEPASAARAVHFAEAAARESGLPGPTVDRVVLAMGEAITNAIRHGNALDPNRRVAVSWRGGGAGGWLHVEDEGTGLDEARLRNATLPTDPMQPNGRGLFLMRTLADEVAVEGSCLKLRFVPRPEEVG